MAQISFRDNPIRTNGDLPAKGAKAPDFQLTGADLADNSLADFAGKRKILNKQAAGLSFAQRRPGLAAWVRPRGIRL